MVILIPSKTREKDLVKVKGKKILIVGFGKSGQAAARYCLENGADVTVNDSRPASDFDLRTYGLKDLRTCFGSHPLELFESADIIVVSPGVPLDLDGVKAANAKGTPIVGEMELFEIKKPVIAITGTNGKSTVTTLVGKMLKKNGTKAVVGGNLGTPFLDMLEEYKNAEYVVLEVSSYQLEISPHLHPYIAVLLNITPDHLDRYSSLNSYIAAKALITKNLIGNDYLVYNESDPEVVNISRSAISKKIGFSLNSKLPDGINLDDAKIVGSHNRENLITAAIIADIAGCSKESIQYVINNFPGLPHRNRFIREVNGVKYFDDSKGTNIGAVEKSLAGFDSKVILIAGGLDKGVDFTPIKEIIHSKTKAVVLIGAAQKRIAMVLNGSTEIVMADDMAAAVREAAARAATGDIVLLSPGCASFDMFKSYAHRGDVFVGEVEKL